jgi:hypothetical protein
MKNLVQAFSITTTNTGGSTLPITMFDANGIGRDTTVKINEGADNFKFSNSGSIDPATIFETTKSAPIKIKAINYQTETSGQFNNAFQFFKANIDGRIIFLPDVISKDRRNTQFDLTLITVNTQIEIDANTGLLIYVNSGETITLTFFVESII